MRINGQWVQFADHERRPVIRGFVVLPNRRPIETVFLVDTGADRTVLTRAILDELRLLAPASAEVSGVGGLVQTVMVESTIWLPCDDGRQATFPGRYAALTDPDALDVSILGRDIIQSLH